MDISKTYRQRTDVQAEVLRQLCFDLHTATLLIRDHRDGGLVDQAKQMAEAVTDKIRKMIPKAEEEDAAEIERDEAFGLLDSLGDDELKEYMLERSREAA